MAAEEEITYFNEKQLKEKIKQTRKKMEAAAKELDFILAAKYRDELKLFQDKLNDK